jgi:hypothetical protein
MPVLKISIYLAAFILSNYIVLWFGSVGLIFTALFLIPFDFVMRCIFHETWKGFELIAKMLLLVICASIITYLINQDTGKIAVASIIGFSGAQLIAGLFYQLTIKQKYFIKVNGSDALGIIFDSIAFQLFAFGLIDWKIFLSQFFLKVAGGLFWYWAIFVKLKLHLKWV